MSYLEKTNVIHNENEYKIFLDSYDIKMSIVSMVQFQI